MKEFLSYPYFEAKVYDLEKIIVSAIEIRGGLGDPKSFQKLVSERESEWSLEQEVYNFLHSMMIDFDEDPDFYKCWRVVRGIEKYQILISCLPNKQSRMNFS